MVKTPVVKSSALVLGLASLALLSGCEIIASVDRSAIPAAEAAGVGGSGAGAAGASGKAGGAGTAGKGGSAGNAGSGGTSAGTGGTSGKGGASGKGGTSGTGGGGTGGGGKGGGTGGGGASGTGGKGGGTGGGGASGAAGASGAGNAGSAGMAGKGGMAGMAGVAGMAGGGMGGTGGAPATCGDNKKNGTEACDGADLGGATCTSALGKPAGGTLTCDGACKLVTTACTFCGDGIKNATEKCDGSDIGGATCASAVGTGSTGVVKCTAGCALDTSMCSAPVTCGNGTIDGTEQCDGTNFGAATCTSVVGSAAMGMLVCTGQCTIDSAGCTFCGDSIKNNGEACDGADVGASTCTTAIGKTATGPLLCTAACALDTTACLYCGDGAINGSEACDGAALGGATCASVVGVGSTGQLACSAACAFDTASCSAPTTCGDGIKNGTDQCDGVDLGGADCTSAVGKPATGILGCTGQCTFNTSSCHYCGNGVKDGAEVCDGTDLGVATCASVLGVPAYGTLDCSAACGFDTSLCVPTNVMINEVQHGALPANENIELVNIAGVAADISGFQLCSRDLAVTTCYTFPASTSIAAGGFVVLHWWQAGTNDAKNFFDGTLPPSALNDVTLYAASGQLTKDVRDYVASSGVSTSSPLIVQATSALQWPNVTSFVDTSAAVEGNSIARKNVAGPVNTETPADWVVATTTTIGAAN